MDKEAIQETAVYVRFGFGAPWICEACPACEGIVKECQQYCPDCGQHISHEDYRKVLETGGVGIETKGGWRRVILDRKLKEEYIRRKLSQIELECDCEDNSIVRIMRDAYIKTCFENEKVKK